MALRAGQSHVRARKRESNRTVIKVCWLPRDRAVAALTGLRKVESYMVRISRLLIVRQMAADTVGWRALEPAAQMAGIAIESGVGAGQREPGDGQMVELRSEPGVQVVALLARDRKVAAHVTRLSCLIVLGMTGVALGREALELTHRGAGVAGSAVNHGVGPDQRKAILVLVDLPHRDLPSLHRVALLTASAELALVNVGVAVRTLVPYVCENWLGVALRTADIFM